MGDLYNLQSLHYPCLFKASKCTKKVGVTSELKSIESHPLKLIHISMRPNSLKCFSELLWYIKVFRQDDTETQNGTTSNSKTASCGFSI